MDSIEHACCQVCKKNFTLDKKQKKLVTQLKSKGQKFIMIECPHCGTSTQYVNTGEGQTEKEEQSVAYRCPVSRCSGWVDWIPDPTPFMGCGECGSMWIKKSNFYDEISDITARYPYRKSCYKKENSTWLPLPLEQHPDDYEILVEQEAIDQKKSLARG